VVTEKVLAYRASLLAAVAGRLPSLADLQLAASISSFNSSGQCNAMPPRRDPNLDH